MSYVTTGTKDPYARCAAGNCTCPLTGSVTIEELHGDSDGPHESSYEKKRGAIILDGRIQMEEL